MHIGIFLCMCIYTYIYMHTFAHTHLPSELLGIIHYNLINFLNLTPFRIKCVCKMRKMINRNKNKLIKKC
uniref:Uncharacterized protein n=1 Tax=Nothoprocta perdicaria TaxID=30464 RepID=A0A8C6YZJ0_NOTPE